MNLTNSPTIILDVTVPSEHFPKKIRYRLLTTGTPARNTAAELFTQLEIIFAGSPAFQCVGPHLIEEDKEGNLISKDNPDYLE
jgi:hypothetical protein